LRLLKRVSYLKKGETITRELKGKPRGHRVLGTKREKKNIAKRIQ
jgi:hypothetical protein